MSVYVICDVSVIDQSRLADYLALATPTVRQYGGIFQVQGGKVRVIEGDWHPSTVVIVRFPNMAQANKWYNSEEYALALAIQPFAMRRNMIFVEGKV